MDKPPSISEMNDLAMALDLLGRTTILPQDKDILLPLLAKTDGDRKRLLMKENFENLVATAATNRDQLMGRSTKPKEIVTLRPRRFATQRPKTGAAGRLGYAHADAGFASTTPDLLFD
jgi:hypothetical protein